jgi:hypothetical protein
LLRYGVPLHMFNGGVGHDREHRGYLQAVTNRSVPQPPYFAPEYTSEAQPSFPHSRAITSPYTLTPADYELGPPPRVKRGDWWPTEFFVHPSGRVDSVLSIQSAVLRRSLHGLVVAGVQLPDLDGVDTTDAHLLAQSFGGPLQVLDVKSRAAWGTKVVLAGALTSASVLSIEALANGGGSAGVRYRWGIPQVRSSLNGCALSDPLMLEGLPKNMQVVSVLDRVKANVRQSRSSPAVFYWESYGFSDEDSVTVKISIEPQMVEQKPEISMPGAVSMTWVEPSSVATLVPIEDRSTSLGRVMSLGLGPLRPGPFILSVLMQSNRCAPVRASRTIVVQ